MIFPQNFDKIVHHYDENFSNTDILFSDSGLAVAEMVMYGIYGGNSTNPIPDTQEGTKMGKSNKEKKIVLVNPRKL